MAYIPWEKLIYEFLSWYCGSTLKYGKEINATIATPLRFAFIYLRNQASLDSSLDIGGITVAGRKIMRALSEVAFIYYRISGLSQNLAFFSVRILKWIHSIYAISHSPLVV